MWDKAKYGKVLVRSYRPSGKPAGVYELELRFLYVQPRNIRFTRTELLNIFIDTYYSGGSFPAEVSDWDRVVLETTEGNHIVLSMEEFERLNEGI